MSLWPDPLARAYETCEALARSHYENFPVASRLLPRAMRPHVAAVYAFARVADDIADEGSAPAPERLAGLRDWQERLHRAVEDPPGGAAPDDRDSLIFAAVGHSIRTLDLPLSLFDDLVSAFGQDTTTMRYDSWLEVLDYCRRSANPIGRLVLLTAGYRDESLARSSDAFCTALQLTNFWQDLGRDWRAGRCVHPARDLVGLRRRGSGPRRRAHDARVDAGDRLALHRANARAVCRRPRGLRRRRRGVCASSCASPGSAAARILERAEREDRGCSSGARRWAPPTRRCCCGAPRGGRARAIVMARKTSFYYSFLVLPAAQRQAIIAVWDFCRAVDDAVDEDAGGTPGLPTGRDAVAFGRADLARAFDGGAAVTPQARRLAPFIAPFDLPRQAFEDVVDGVAMDLDTTRYETFADLYEYCRRVASAVGMICIRIFGCVDEQAREYALNLGVALQLTNILRDVKDDLARGRVYLPLDDLRTCGCTVDDLARGVVTEQVRALMTFECRRAREFYRKAAALVPPEDRRRLAAAEIMRAVYFETLMRIERNGYDVFTARTRVPRPRQAMIALRQWLWT